MPDFNFAPSPFDEFWPPNVFAQQGALAPPFDNDEYGGMPLELRIALLHAAYSSAMAKVAAAFARPTQEVMPVMPDAFHLQPPPIFYDPFAAEAGHVDMQVGWPAVFNAYPQPQAWPQYQQWADAAGYMPAYPVPPANNGDNVPAPVLAPGEPVLGSQCVRR